MGRLRVVTFKIPENELLKLDELVNIGVYKSRSHAIRIAIRRLLADVVW